MNGIQLEETARFLELQEEFRKVYDRQKPLADRLASIKSEIRELAGEHGVEQIETDVMTMRTGEQNSFNVSDFKVSHPQLYKRFLKTNRRITFTRVKRR